MPAEEAVVPHPLVPGPSVSSRAGWSVVAAGMADRL
jgi:hypothetical protein